MHAHALSDEQDRLLQQGFSGYLAKPISSSQLRETIEEYTGYACRGGNGSQLPVAEIRDTRRRIRPSTRQQQRQCVSVDESIELAAGKEDLAEELFSMLLEQLHTDLPEIRRLWQQNELDGMLDTVHKLHGATRYCGVPELREAAHRLETALKRATPDREYLKDQLLGAMERLQAWSEQTDWQPMFRGHRHRVSAD